MHSIPGPALLLAAQPPGPSESHQELTLSWDLETLPLFSTSRAVNAYQMDLRSSARRSMATGGGGRGGSAEAEDPVPGNRLPRQPRALGDARSSSAICLGAPRRSPRAPSPPYGPPHRSPTVPWPAGLCPRTPMHTEVQSGAQGTQPSQGFGTIR